MDQTLTAQFDVELKSLLESIYHQYNYDFRQYALASMKRALVHAMDMMGCATLTTLQEKVLHDPACFYDLLQSLTIPVSEMFRDPTYFLGLREGVMPHLRTYPSLKIWVAGCSTGEEVYSLAILLQEEDLLERSILYATDINQRSLEKAEKGILSLEALNQFTHNYQKSGGKHSLSGYYTDTADVLKFKSSVRKNIVFTDHSLVTDAVFSETHLISCRNVLIYFDRELQNKVFGLFHESLCRKGFLGLGLQETIQFSQYSKYFDAFVKKDRIFQKV